jgi:hypothetical protein
MASIEDLAGNVLVSIVGGGLAGGIISELRSRAAERRAVARERAVTFRDRQRRAIEETRLDYAAANETALSLAAGAARPSHTYYPNAQMWLIGDPTLILETVQIRQELIARNVDNACQGAI